MGANEVRMKAKAQNTPAYSERIEAPKVTLVPPAEEESLDGGRALAPGAHPLKVSIFCGGRGSATVIREFLRRKGVSLSLLVNAYDDGLSTGAIRRHIPGMLGPSDFRKNLSHLLEFYSSGRYALAELFEYRFKSDLNFKERTALVDFSTGKIDAKQIPLTELKQLMSRIDDEALTFVRKFLDGFFQHEIVAEKGFNFNDCAVGNLIFAGAYLSVGKRFNHAIIELAKAFKTRAGLINVSDGEDRILVALKENGEVLAHEADIVGKQSASKIHGLYLLPTALSAEQLDALNKADLKTKEKTLAGLEKNVSVSELAVEQLLSSNIIVFGAGTQHSSLLPSYKTQGVGEAIRKSAALMRVMLVNIEEDHDIVGMTASDLVDRTLDYLGDPENKLGTMTHILLNNVPGKNGKNIRPGLLKEGTNYKGATLQATNLVHPVFPYAHCGHKTVDAIFELYEQRTSHLNRNLTIYVDLEKRATAISHLVDEFLDIDWQKYFSQIHLVINHPFEYRSALPDHLKISNISRVGVFSELKFFQQWLEEENSQYLVTLVGDGIYSLEDILRSFQLLDRNFCGAVFGSRSQSKRQLINSIRAVYGQSRLFYFLGSVASAVFSLSFWMRFGLLFSDPLTGYRMYSRRTMQSLLKSKALSKRWLTSSSITAVLIKNSVEIAEIPVQYQNLKGFTNLRRRIKRTLLNLLGMFV